MGVAAEGCRAAFEGDEHVIKLGSGDGCTSQNVPRTAEVLTFRGAADHPRLLLRAGVGRGSV